MHSPVQQTCGQFRQGETHSVPASPASKPKPEPGSSGDVTGIGVQHAVWYDVEYQVQPLYNAFHHYQCHAALLSMLPAGNSLITMLACKAVKPLHC